MCTKVVVTKNRNNILTGRNMDWLERFNTNLWGFPAGIIRESLGSGNLGRFEWTSKFKSIATCLTLDTEDDGTEVGSTTDGLNEKGLAVNTLYLSESNYGELKHNNEKKMGMGIWGQYNVM